MNNQDASPLFRQVSVEARRQGWTSRAQLPANLPLRVTAFLSALLAASVICFLYFGEYTRRVRAAGVILPATGLVRITAPVDGWITEALHEEGDHVKQGDHLYSLSVDHVTREGPVQDHLARLLRQRRQEITAEIVRRKALDRVEKQQLAKALEYARKELQQATLHHALLGEFAAKLKQRSEVQESLLGRGLSTLTQLEPRQSEYMSYRLQFETMEHQLLQLRARMDRMSAELSMFDQKALSAVDALERQLHEIDLRIAESEVRREIRILAPNAGRLTNVMVHPGQPVKTGSPMLTILPDGHLQGHLLVPGTAVGFIEPDDPVLMRYESFPYQHFGQFSGRVAAVSHSALRPEELVHLGLASPTPGFSASLYRVTVELDEQEMLRDRRVHLRPGMQLEAHMLGERRRLYQWLLSPLYQLTERLARK